MRYIYAIIFMLAATTVCAQEDNFYDRLLRKGYDTINVENRGLRQFLDDCSYGNPETAGNYNYSIVKKYSKGVPSKPNGYMLRWQSDTPSEEIESVVVTIIESEVERDASYLDKNEHKKNVKRYYPNAKSKEYLLCNMCPQRYCYYKIEEVLMNGQKKVVKRGKFFTDGQIRMLSVDGMTNVRDFGGWFTSFDRPVIYGRLFRGNQPDGITDKGRNDFVKNEHITADLDLRGKNLGKSPFGPLEEVEYYVTNNQRYKLALTDRTGVLAKDIGIIAQVLRKGGNLFLHCHHGTNRAGTLSFLIEGILGYSEADLSGDYELSSFAYGISRSYTFGDMLPVIWSYGSEGDDLTQCFYNYALHIGVSEADLDTIRCVMLGLSPKDPRILRAHKRRK